MSLKQTTKTEANTYQLEVSVDAETFEKAVNAAYRKEVKKINIPGFRKGKAPRNIIEKMYGEQFFYENAVNAVYPEAVDNAIKESGLDVIDAQVEEVTEVGKNGVEFKVIVVVYPEEVSLKEYKGLELTKKPISVSDKDLEEELKKIQTKNSRLITIEDRAAEDGDIATISYLGKVDGVPFEGGQSDSHNLTLGAGQFIPGFEEQVVGHKLGEAFDITVTFPEEYHSEDLSGKEAVFSIEIKELKKRELPDLDDEFVKDVSEFDTLDEYKADIRAKLIEDAEHKAMDDVDNQIIDILVENLEAEIPDALYERKVDDVYRDFAYRLQSQGLDMETYMQYTGLDQSAMREQMRPQAEKQVKIRLALEKIAELENIVITEEEIETEYQKIADAYGMPVDKVKEAVDGGSISKKDLEMDIKVEKAISIVRENSVITEKAEIEE